MSNEEFLQNYKRKPSIRKFTPTHLIKLKPPGDSPKKDKPSIKRLVKRRTKMLLEEQKFALKTIPEANESEQTQRDLNSQVDHNHQVL